ncbi:TBC1 domain family member 17 [Elysia marginata]|uniref:TBC1 domain family member 17 n=1 Tax=Elysia marginata TaxID=1093978 RepID=A0AAV4HBX5_9GAST|nr:TBC1 domain family member 17 [Elysia marginata]
MIIPLFSQHINDISLSIPLEETLRKAEAIFLQLRDYKKLPVSVKEILGLLPPANLPASQSMENSMFASSTSTSSSSLQQEAGVKVDTPTLMAGGASTTKGVSPSGSGSDLAKGSAGAAACSANVARSIGMSARYGGRGRPGAGGNYGGGTAGGMDDTHKVFT